MGAIPGSLTAQMPYQRAAQARVLGVILGGQFGFRQQVAGVLRRSGIPHGLEAGQARSILGLEAGILRTAHAALLTHLATYGLTVGRYGAYEAEFACVGTLGTNVSARRITGISRSARLEMLHMAEGIWSFRNRYLQNIAMLLAPALAAMECTLTTRLGG